MGPISEFMGQVAGFVKEHKTSDVIQAVQHLDWQLVLHSPLFWLISIPSVLLLLWRREYGILIATSSGALFLALVQYTAPMQSEGISVAQLIKFLGGCVLLLGINVYYFFMAKD